MMWHGWLPRAAGQTVGRSGSAPFFLMGSVIAAGQLLGQHHQGLAVIAGR